MNSRIIYHPHTNNILVREQYGFRKGTSTENSTFRLTDRIVKYTRINQIMQVERIFGGSAKAYDCGNHKIILAKLYFCGI
jgi:hypothetical protein